MFAPADRRDALFALYAFNLEIARIRESVREPMLGQIRLQWWRDVLDRLAKGDAAPAHPVAEPLGEAVQCFSLSHGEFERLLEAREADLDDAPPSTLAALERYADDTAGTVTRLAVEVLDVRESNAMCAARHVGIAWALAGLLRAVPFHAVAGRLYLPQELLEGHGVTASQILSGASSPELCAVAAEVAGRARHHIAAARELRRDVPRRAVAALLPATLASRYLTMLQRHHHDPFAAGWAAPRPQPLRLSLAALLGRY